ncbi:MAG TPA: hypothetical protein VGR71_00745 [Nitrospira sp.]|nr:hypothetical protein [Nitrospira sp.]
MRSTKPTMAMRMVIAGADVEVVDQKLGQCPDGRTPAAFDCRKIMLRLFGERVELCVSLLQRHPRGESGKYIQETILAAIGRPVLGGESDRRPELRREAKVPEISGHDAGYHIILAVEAHGLSHDRRIRSVATLPQPMAQDDDMVVPGLVLPGEESAAQLRNGAEDGEIVCGDRGVRNCFRLLSGTRQAASPIFIRGADFREEMLVASPEEVVGRRNWIRTCLK